MSITRFVGDSAVFDELDSEDTYIYTKKMEAVTLGKNPTNPPALATAGITVGMKYTVGTDVANLIFKVPRNYDTGDASVWFNWTKSAVGADESTKCVKWQLKYLKIAPGDDCNNGEATLSVEDAYDSSDLSAQIIHATAAVTIPAASLIANGSLSFEFCAITPSGAALSDEPLLLSVAFQCTCTKIM